MCTFPHAPDLASASQSGDGNVWSSLFDEPLDSQDVFDPSTGLPLVNHPPTLPPMGGGAGVGSVDQWVLDETKKLDAQQKIQQQKLLDLQQVCVCACLLVHTGCMHMYMYIHCVSHHVASMCVEHSVSHASCGVCLGVVWCGVGDQAIPYHHSMFTFEDQVMFVCVCACQGLSLP